MSENLFKGYAAFLGLFLFILGLNSPQTTERQTELKSSGCYITQHMHISNCLAICISTKSFHLPGKVCVSKLCMTLKINSFSSVSCSTTCHNHRNHSPFYTSSMLPWSRTNCSLTNLRFYRTTRAKYTFSITPTSLNTETS